jgi:hypothetical protein
MAFDPPRKGTFFTRLVRRLRRMPARVCEVGSHASSCAYTWDRIRNLRRGPHDGLIVLIEILLVGGAKIPHRSGRVARLRIPVIVISHSGRR